MRRNRGFTLIELVIVVAILGILVAIAFPSYQAQIRKSNRAATQAYIADLANKETLYLQTARSYGSLADLGINPLNIPADVSKYYDVVIATTAGPPPGFTITATPKAGQIPDGWLAIDNNGTKISQYPDKW